MPDPEEIARMREEIKAIADQIGELAIAAAAIDLDAFLDLAERVGSPQALTAGIEPRAVTSAGDWVELAGLLKPFRDAAVERIEQIQKEDSSDDV
jgi:hypothetical protein